MDGHNCLKLECCVEAKEHEWVHRFEVWVFAKLQIGKGSLHTERDGPFEIYLLVKRRNGIGGGGSGEPTIVVSVVGPSLGHNGPKSQLADMTPKRELDVRSHIRIANNVSVIANSEPATDYKRRECEVKLHRIGSLVIQFTFKFS